MGKQRGEEGKNFRPEDMGRGAAERWKSTVRAETLSVHGMLKKDTELMVLLHSMHMGKESLWG